VNATYMTDGEIRQEYAKRAPWGLYCSVDLKNCSPDAVRNEIGIKNFVKELCDRIEMKRPRLFISARTKKLQASPWFN
jgi:hypothetical protein